MPPRESTLLDLLLRVTERRQVGKADLQGPSSTTTSAIVPVNLNGAS